MTTPIQIYQEAIPPTCVSRNGHSHTAKHMEYVLQASLVQQLISDRGVTALTGKAGTVVYFHCNLFHSSNANTSPWDRRVILITHAEDPTEGDSTSKTLL
jgi:ectoine hydroxylase-related dioxygenase (phytanoyl-CoA dioxygenase family)